MRAGKVVLALDGMGGDHAPDVVVNGADIARERYPGTTYLLFGDPAKLKPLVDKRKGLAQALEIVPAADAVSADDKPSFALRRRRKSSMWLACQAAAEGRADTSSRPATPARCWPFRCSPCACSTARIGRRWPRSCRPRAARR